jgi:hypothetical protein
MSLISKPTNILNGFKPVVSGFKHIYESLTSGNSDIYIHTMDSAIDSLDLDTLSTRALWFNETLSSATGGHSDGYHYRYIYTDEHYKDPNFLISLDSQMDSLSAQSNQWMDKWLVYNISISGSIGGSISGTIHAFDYDDDWNDHTYDSVGGNSTVGMSAETYGFDYGASADLNTTKLQVVASGGLGVDWSSATEFDCTLFNSTSISAVASSNISSATNILCWRFKLIETSQQLETNSSSGWFENSGGGETYDLSLSATPVIGSRSSEIISITGDQYIQSQLVNATDFEWSVVSESYNIVIS